MAGIFLVATPAGAQFDDRDAELGNSVVFSVREGSLRNNIDRLATEAGWRLVAWDQTVQRDNAVLDWRILAEYTLNADSIDAALEQLIAPYGLHARLHEADRTIAIYLFEKVRFERGED